MYFGRRHSAKITLREVLRFNCKSCGYTADAAVEATGRGQGNSPFFLDESGAEDRAVSSAEEDARNNLVDTLRLATCPKCHKRDAGAVRWAKVKTAVLAIFLGSLTTGAMWFFRWGPSFPLQVAAGLAIAAVTFVIARRRWLTADERVVFPRLRAKRDKPTLPPVQQPRREGNPFRESPSVPIQVIETARPVAAPPIVPGDPSDKPTFLK